MSFVYEEVILSLPPMLKLKIKKCWSTRLHNIPTLIRFHDTPQRLLVRLIVHFFKSIQSSQTSGKYGVGENESLDSRMPGEQSLQVILVCVEGMT